MGVFVQHYLLPQAVYVSACVSRSRLNVSSGCLGTAGPLATGCRGRQGWAWPEPVCCSLARSLSRHKGGSLAQRQSAEGRVSRQMPHMQISPGGRGFEPFAARLTPSVLERSLHNPSAHKDDLYKHTVEAYVPCYVPCYVPYETLAFTVNF